MNTFHVPLVLWQNWDILAMTMKPLFNGPPSPEEFQRQLSDFVRHHFQTARGPTPAYETSGAPESKESQARPEQFAFDYKPRDIKAHLDRFVIKQDEAKKVLSIAVCDHYNHANYLRRLEKEDAARAEETEYAKQNVILVGPTGVGKTYLIKHIAE